MMPSATTTSDARDVHRGREGWLFLIGGSNDALRYYTSPDAFTDVAMQAWMRLLRERRERCRDLEAAYMHLIVPDKLAVYHDKFDGSLPYRARSPASRIPQAARDAGLGDVVVDILPAFMRARRRARLYWQTDTHWTFEGCLVAYRVLCDRLGLEADADIVRGDSDSFELLLDLGQKLDPPVREQFYTGRVAQRARRVSVNPLVSWKERHGLENDGGLHVGSNVVFCNHHADAARKCAVLFGDSFSEYRTHLLTGMLAETFRELHFVWSAGIDWNYVRRVRPDLVITELAERFAGQVPDDDFDLDRYTVQRLAPLVAAAAPAPGRSVSPASSGA